MNGLLIINKQKDMTSRDVVNIVGKTLKTRKIGHTGTLDPMATGVLVLAVGKSLKLIEDLTNLDKEYIAEVTLGVFTDTLDITGNILEEKNNFVVSKNNIIKVLNSFKGEYNMEVPKYSAIKVNGKKLYEYARNNEKVKLPIKKVYINSIEFIDLKENKFRFKCNVSKGTYIRSLIRDICRKLGIIGTMSSLVRTKQGEFKLEDALFINQIEQNTKLISPKEFINLPKIETSKTFYEKIKNGQKLENIYKYKKFCFIYENEIIAIYEIDENDNNKVKPKKVLV